MIEKFAYQLLPPTQQYKINRLEERIKACSSVAHLAGVGAVLILATILLLSSRIPDIVVATATDIMFTSIAACIISLFVRQCYQRDIRNKLESVRMCLVPGKIFFKSDFPDDENPESLWGRFCNEIHVGLGAVKLFRHPDHPGVVYLKLFHTCFEDSNPMFGCGSILFRDLPDKVRYTEWNIDGQVVRHSLPSLTALNTLRELIDYMLTHPDRRERAIALATA